MIDEKVSKKEDFIKISSKTWNALKANPAFNELLEIIEDYETLSEAKLKDNSKGIELHEFLRKRKAG